MGATIIKFKKESTQKLSSTQKAFLEKLLKGPTMTKKQIREYEKRYPWLKKYKD